eukprot:45003-Chlamydomonas_euryale.AAC.1
MHQSSIPSGTTRPALRRRRPLGCCNSSPAGPRHPSVAHTIQAPTSSSQPASQPASWPGRQCYARPLMGVSVCVDVFLSVWTCFCLCGRVSVCVDV